MRLKGKPVQLRDIYFLKPFLRAICQIGLLFSILFGLLNNSIREAVASIEETGFNSELVQTKRGRQ